jgi:predicted 2-oxoglutarate/Fe(II)-dependent dioxygenase YbiX
MGYQLTPIQPAPLVIASGIEATTLNAYLAGARSTVEPLVSPTFGNNLQGLRRDYTHRKSYDFDPYTQPQAHELLHAIVGQTKQHAGRLWRNPELLDAHTDWRAANAQGLKYVVGGKFFAHADDRVRVAMTSLGNEGERRWVRNRPERQIVSILYLNDDYEGGELYFPTLTGDDGKELRIKPKAGELVIFGGDDRYLHGVDEVTAGERYCVTLWFAPLPLEAAETADSVRRLYDEELKRNNGGANAETKSKGKP